MAYPLYRLILSNEDVGSQIFDDYDGWKEISLVLERDEEFHSIVELCETPLIFYGTSKVYIVNIIDTYGVDSTIDIQIDISVNEGGTFNTIFTGVLALEEYKEVYEGESSYHLTVPVLPNEFWQKFKNRYDTPVQIGSTTDLDGNPSQSISSNTLNLSSQAIVKSTFIRQDDTGLVDVDYGSTQTNPLVYFLLAYPVIDLDELEERFTYPLQMQTTSIEDDLKYLYEIKEGGDYTAKVRLNFRISALNFISPDVDDYEMLFYVVRVQSDGTRTQTTMATVSGTSANPNLALAVDVTSSDISLTLNAGDLLYFYGTFTADNASNIALSYVDDSGETYLSLIGETVTPNTTSPIFRIHEAFNSVCNQITNQDRSFYSPNMGNTSTQIRTYGSDEPNSYIGLTKGVNIRGYSLTDKPFSASFKQLWEGINPIMNYGLGYDVDDSSPTVDYIEILPVEEFYVKDSHITLSNIENLIRTEEPDRYIKEVEIGYKKWKSEEIGGIDDPQTKRRYATKFKTFGKAIKILSEFYTASLGIEVTRRKRVQENEDWKLDDEIFAIALDRTSPSNPDLDDDFSSITDLNNSDTRYNLRLTPARSLLRHLNILSAGLTKYAGSIFKFVLGEGNYDFTSTQTNTARGDFDNSPLAENQDITWDYYGSIANSAQETIFIPTIYEFEIELSYEQFTSFKTNRKRSFSISESNVNYKEVFLLRLEYMPSMGTAKFKAIKAY